MEFIDVLSIVNSGGVVAVLLMVLNLMFKGSLVSSSVMTSIVAETTRQVLEQLSCPLQVNLPPD